MIKNYSRILIAIILLIKNWPQVIFNKLFHLKIQNLILRNGIILCIDDIFGPADLSMFAEIWYHQYYNPVGFEIQDTDVVFDVGGNDGFFSMYAAYKAKQGNVYVFEPVPRLADRIRKSVATNQIHHVVVESVALGKESGDRVLYISGIHNGCHSLYERKGSSEEISVPVLSLEGYCVSNHIPIIDFLKLDCEGAEYEIITEESVPFFKSHVRRIAMEHHDDITHHTHQEIVEILEKANFEVTVIGGYLYARNKTN